MEKEKIIEAEVVSEEQEQDISELKPVVNYDNEQSKFVTNIPEMNEALKAGLAWYDYEVTEATKDDAKADRTKLNALEKEITETRKAYAAKFNTWKPIEKSIMEMEKLVKATSDKLKRGIDALNLKAEQEKVASFKAHWDSLQTGIKYELVHNPKFKNKEYTEKRWKEELDAKAAQIAKEKDFVKAMLDAKAELNDTERQMVFTIYNRTINQSEALNKIVEIEEAKLRAKALEEERKTIEAQRKKEEEYIDQHEEAPLSEAANMTSEEPMWFLRIECSGTRDQMQNFGKLIEECGLVINKKVFGKSISEMIQKWEEKYGK